MSPTRTDRGINRKNARSEPYPTPNAHPFPKYRKPGMPSPPSDEDKENQAPADKIKSPRAKQGASKDPGRSELPAHYLDVPLEEIKGEVPVYENAATIRGKLNKLIESKTRIPGSNKTFNKTTLSKELQALAQRHHPVETYQGFGNHGPSLNSLSRFLKKSGTMAGGDSEAYYFGNMLLEKLRIWNGNKKTKAQERAEMEYPNGRVRCDPANVRIKCRPDEIPTYAEIAERGR